MCVRVCVCVSDTYTRARTLTRDHKGRDARRCQGEINDMLWRCVCPL